MYRFVESILFSDGAPQNMEAHQARLADTWHAFFNGFCPYQLDIILKDIRAGKGKWKTRFLYDETGFSVTTEPYNQRVIRSLRLITADDARYPYKFTEKTELDELLRKRGAADEILIVKNGLITDTSFSNVAFTDGRRWVTPESYLLNGTRRKQLMKTGQLSTARITPADLPGYKQISFINAMLDLEESVMDVKNITSL